MAVVRAGVRRRLENHPNVIICSSNINDYFFCYRAYQLDFLRLLCVEGPLRMENNTLSPCAGENVVLYDCLPDEYQRF